MQFRTFDNTKNKGYKYDTQDIISKVTMAADNIDSLNPDYKSLLGKGRINADKAIQSMMDITVPTTPKVTDEGEFTVKNQLYASWSAEDAESGIFEYQYKLTQNGNLIRDWTTTEKYNYVTVGGLNLADGTYQFSVKAENKVGLWSSVGYSDGIIIDTVLPSLTHTAITYVPKNNPINFTATSSDSGSGIQAVTLYWRKRILRIYGWIWSELRSAPMTNQGNNVYAVTLLDSQVEDRKIKYYIKTTDKAGNTKQTPEYTISRE